MEAPLAENATIPLSVEQAHYLKTVLRRPDGAALRVFNGKDGEWLGSLTFAAKKDANVALTRQIRSQPDRALNLHLFFAPIKKDRMDFMIEKAVELGVTDFHPLLTQFTTIRDINTERMTRQIAEAAEQCERLDLPGLHDLRPWKEFLSMDEPSLTILAALEREDTPFIGSITPIPAEAGLLVGPEGGFSDAEKSALLQLKWVKPVSLGAQILRSETAAIFGLSALLTNFTK